MPFSILSGCLLETFPLHTKILSPLRLNFLAIKPFLDYTLTKGGNFMKLCAIICEYNPFHNGHQYHIKKSLEQSGCDAVLCIMSPNFSQRGEPTIVNKKIRALMAMEGGASAVVSIPTYFAATNAETFAMAAVKIACSFKDVTHLSFGSECGDVESITELAEFLYKEPAFYSQAIKKLLKEGYSLGTSKVRALAECINKNLVSFTKPKVVLDMLTQPNNILAVEYVRALFKVKNKKIKPITVKRQEPYHGFDFEFGYKLSNASSIRNSIIKSKRIWNIRKYIPPKSFLIFANHLKLNNIPNYKLWGTFALFKLRTTSANELKINYDVVEGFENKLILSTRESVNYEQFLERTVSRRYSHNRVQRIIASCILNLRSEVTKRIFDIKTLPYIKVIACVNDRKLLASLQNADTTIITRKSDGLKAIKDDYAKLLMFTENRANALYDLLVDTPESEQIKKAEMNDIFDKTIFVKKSEQ